ncbi:hypothetical protein LCGC14_2774630, partial [marine sediment metagenome]
TPKVNNGPSRALVYQQERAARPFNQETTVVPEVRVEPITDPSRLLERPKSEVKIATPVEEAATRLGVERQEAVARTVEETVELVREREAPTEAAEPGRVVGELVPVGQLPKADITRRAALQGAGDGQAGKASENIYQKGTDAFKAYDEAYNRAFDIEIAMEPDLVRPELPLEVEAEVNQGRMLRESEQRQTIADEVIDELGPTETKEPEPLNPDV